MCATLCRAPASQIAGPSDRTGRGAIMTSRKAKWRPSYDIASPDHKSRIASMHSCMRPTRWLKSTPMAVNWASVAGLENPAPIPATRRPSEMRSSVANCCASGIGWRSAGSSTAVPTVTRSVRAATAARSVSGSAR